VTRVAIVCALAALACAGAASAGPVPVMERASAGMLTIELTYHLDKATEDFERRYTHMHLKVLRSDIAQIDADVPRVCPGCSTWPGSGGDPASSSVRARDLDGDGEPEAMLDLYTGGAHCCLYTTFFRYVGGQYVRRVHSWSNPGYRLRDVGSDGRTEFITADDRFNYAFSCYACAGAPLLVQRYAQGKLVNVTRRFPQLARADAARWWATYKKALRVHVPPTGILPTYLADEYLAGRSDAGWARVRKAVARADWTRTAEPRWRKRANYLKAVRRFLVKTGYAR
jgi:hypothetical protein